MTEPILELVLKGGDPEKTIAVACGTCRNVCIDAAAAVHCCQPKVCRTCGAAETPRYRLDCGACQANKSAAHLRARFDKAEKVLVGDYRGEYVVLDGDEDITSVDEIFDENEQAPTEDRITWAWACRPLGWPALSATHVIEQLTEEMDEEVSEKLDPETLQAALDAWLREQPEPRWFIEDNTRVVLFEPNGGP